MAQNLGLRKQNKHSRRKYSSGLPKRRGTQILERMENPRNLHSLLDYRRNLLQQRQPKLLGCHEYQKNHYCRTQRQFLQQTIYRSGEPGRNSPITKFKIK